MNTPTEPGLVSRAEIAAMDEFLRALREGKTPSVEGHLCRYPEFRDSLRPVLEGAELFHREYGRLQQKYPGISLCRLFGLES